MNQKSAIISLIAASIIWGATGPIMKQTLVFVPVFSLAFIRFGIASLILFPFVIKKLSVNKKDLPLIIICSLLGVTLNISLFFFGLTLTSAINAGIIIASTPILTLIFSHFLLNEALRKNLLVGGFFGILGISTIIATDILNHGLSLSPIGDLLILSAILTFIFYEILSKKLFKTYNAFTLTFYSFLIGALTFFPASILEFKSNPLWISNITNEAILGIIYGTLFSSLSAYSLWLYGLSKMQASRVGFFFYLDPVAATITAIIVLSEKITIPFVFGAIFIFLGLFIAEQNFNYLHVISRFLKPKDNKTSAYSAVVNH